MSSSVHIANLTKSFAGREVLHGVNAHVPAGQVAALVGPSGSGKSTLLRCVNHLEKPDAGYVRVGDEIIGYTEDRGRLRELRPKAVAAQRSRIGMVFQQFNLFGHMTAAQNIIEGPLARGIRPAAARKRASELLERVGLGGREDTYPRQLSGGQQQRVAIARALAMDPDVILFDEPTSALDPELVGEVLAVIKDLATTGITLLVVTHEIRFAQEIADQVLFLDEGSVVASGPPDVVFGPEANERARAFLGAVL